jgi:hypothetical protein
MEGSETGHEDYCRSLALSVGAQLLLFSAGSRRVQVRLSFGQWCTAANDPDIVSGSV